MVRSSRWYLDHALWLELFALVNLGFLAPDIYLAHSTNLFRDPAEYVPLAFSLAAPVLLIAALVAWRRGAMRAWRGLGYLVGWGSVVVGIVGLLLHLESHFFRENTLASLVYTAPFAAPLAYTGIGLLLILNRMVDAESIEWPQAVVLLALGGFIGNFIFSLADHAQNGFYHETEWIAVAGSAFGVGFLVVPLVMPIGRSFLAGCAILMAVEVLIGLLGFYYHTMANLAGPSSVMMENFVYGAPAMAPMLFPNLALLTAMGLWVWDRHLRAEEVRPEEPIVSADVGAV